MRNTENLIMFIRTHLNQANPLPPHPHLHLQLQGMRDPFNQGTVHFVCWFGGMCVDQESGQEISVVFLRRMAQLTRVSSWTVPDLDMLVCRVGRSVHD